jgi:hypothetical protein
MPGVAVRLNDRPLVARLDTGGSFVHVTRAQAQALGIASAGCERSFAGLVTAPVWYGVADLDLGAARLRNVPVHVHADGTLPIDTVAKAFGADVGLLIGTGVFERFLTTIDAPGGRLVLSRRGDAAQLARWTGRAHDVPFLLLGSHIMVARGRVGERPVNFFVDSGLAVFNHEQGQAGLLLPRRTLEAWNLRAPSGHAFAAIPSPVGVGSAVRERLTAFVVSNRTWRQFGTWNGLDVTALLSHAFLKHFAWTLDFDRQVYWLRDARHGEETIARN